MRSNSSEDLAAMVAGYVECLLWAGLDWTDTVDNGGTESNPRPLDENYSPDDIAPGALLSIEADCASFRAVCGSDLADIDPGQAGHDFYLTRNGHGTGFWDRGLGAIGDRLTAAAHAYGDSGEYVATTGLIYV